MVDHNLFLLFSRKIIQVRQRSDPSRMKQSERCRQHFSESLFIVMFSFFCPFLLLFFFHPLFGYRKLWVDAAGSTPNRASRLCGTFSLLLLLPGHLFSVNDTHKVKKKIAFRRFSKCPPLIMDYITVHWIYIFFVQVIPLIGSL